jgi:hypothetical protein
MEEHDRAFWSSLTQLGRRAISKARDVPALPAAPIRPIPLLSAVSAPPNRPIQPLLVPRAPTPTASSPALACLPTLTPGQPGPARAADALPPGPAYPQTGTVPGTRSSPRPDARQAASPGPGRSGLAQRLLRHLCLRR